MNYGGHYALDFHPIAYPSEYHGRPTECPGQCPPATANSRHPFSPLLLLQLLYDWALPTTIGWRPLSLRPTRPNTRLSPVPLSRPDLHFSSQAQPVQPWKHVSQPWNNWPPLYKRPILNISSRRLHSDDLCGSDWPSLLLLDWLAFYAAHCHVQCCLVILWSLLAQF